MLTTILTLLPLLEPAIKGAENLFRGVKKAGPVKLDTVVAAVQPKIDELVKAGKLPPAASDAATITKAIDFFVHLLKHDGQLDVPESTTAPASSETTGETTGFVPAILGLDSPVVNGTVSPQQAKKYLVTFTEVS